jgi:hypothetical protein
MPGLRRHRLPAGYYTARARQKDLSSALHEVRREGTITVTFMSAPSRGASAIPTPPRNGNGAAASIQAAIPGSIGGPVDIPPGLSFGLRPFSSVSEKKPAGVTRSAFPCDCRLRANVRFCRITGQC